MSFYAHFEDDKHRDMDDWEITLVHQTDSVNDLRRKSFWQYEVGTFQPNALNERDVALFCRLALSSLLVFIFSGLTHYIYCSAFIFTITTRVLIILLYPNILIVVLIITIIKFYT